MLTILLLYFFFGSFVGLMAGLMGFGGAMIMVPILHFTLARQGVAPDLIHHLAIATSMANILFTSSMATYAHNKRGAVPWKSVTWMVPGILAGSFAGSYITSFIPAAPLTIAFACFLMYATIQMFIPIRPKASRHMPARWGQILLGVVIGLLSGVLGIGGAAITMPILLVCGIPIISVIASAGAFGFPIAIAGCAGYMLSAWGNPDLPEYSLGFIYLPALLGLAPSSMLTTPLGVRLSHALPTKTLRQGLGLLLFFMAIRMAYGAL